MLSLNLVSAAEGDEFNSIKKTNHCKAALQKILSIFRSRLLVVTIAEMYSKNHAV